MAVSIADFFAQVVPWPANGEPGFINMHYTMPNHPGMSGKPFNDIGAFLSFIPWCNTHPGYVKDVYFCLSRQAKVGALVNGKVKVARHALDATHLNAIWLDVDGNKPNKPDKGYPTKNAALDAIAAFVVAAQLPGPTALVDSGGGFHPYWISDKVLTQAEWRPYAEGLWALAQKHGLKCDPVTTDAARILRVPGTFNWKTAPPAEVKLIFLKPALDFATALKALPALTPVHVSALPHSNTVHSSLILNPEKFPARPPITADKLAEDCRYEPVSLPLDAFSMIPRCPHYLQAIQNGGKRDNQGLWMQTVLGATWFENGRAIAHKLSNKHPGYSPEETDAMFDRKVADREARGLGWPSCKTFENNGSVSCIACPLKGTIRSPLNICSTVAPPTPPSFTQVQPPSPTVVNSLSLPRGYGVENGYVGYMKTVKLGNGATSDEFEKLFLCEVSNPWAEREPNQIHFTASMSLGLTDDITVKQENMAAGQPLALTLAKQGVKFDPSHKDELAKFMMFWLEQLHLAKQATLSIPFGWWMQGGAAHGFAYAGILVKDDKTRVASGTGDMQVRHDYMPKGKIEPWFRALKLVTDQHRPSIEVIAAAAFASPLMQFTGQHSACLTGWSQSGGNKSTAANVGLAVWGNPKKTKEVSGTSPKSLLHKMGEIRNLPLYWDDVSDADKLTEAGLTVLDATQGADGGKLFQDRTQRDKGEWQTLMVICSNLSLFDTFVKKVKNNTAGVNRIFEFYVDGATDTTPGRMQSWEAQQIVQDLEENYGRVGEQYTMLLASDPAALKAAVTHTMEKFGKKVQDRNDERFWVAICATILVGAAMANLLHATFNVPEIEAFLIKSFLAMRDRVTNEALVGSSYANTTACLSGFIKAHTYDMICVQSLPPPKPGKPMKVDVLPGGPDPTHKYAIHIQCILDKRVIRISKAEFYAYMDYHKHSVAAVTAGLIEHYGMVRPFPTQNLCAGTIYRGGPEQLIVLTVPVGSWLEDVMFARTAADQMPTQTGQSAAVSSTAAPASPPPAGTPSP